MCRLSCLYCLPKEIYRYFTVDGAKWFLSNHSLKLTDPTMFNDPFETAIDYQKSLYTTGFKKLCGYCEEPTPADVLHLNNVLFKELSSYGVVCFSESAIDILMWAYYGESHKGVCIEFEPPKDICFFKDLYRLKYKNGFESIKKGDGEDWDYMDIITAKAECWAHEKEWRVVKNKKDCSFLKDDKDMFLWTINPQAIKSVIFGCNMTDYRNVGDTQLQNYLEIIKQLKRPEYAHIEIKQIQMDPFEYKLHCNKVPFFVYEMQSKVVIISFDNQKVCIDNGGKEDLVIFYEAIMCKWEKLEIPLSEGIYRLHNFEDPFIQLRILSENKI